MSLVDDKRVHARTVVVLKDQCKLIIPPLVKDQIDHLHAKVRKNTEWSGILIYNTIEGTVNDPKGWVIEIEEVIPMDVGTGSYTEYEIKPDDEYASNRWMEALADGKKMGHIHTHHNMKCFFSGTDMSELHDNAPNHAFYLSLIVNYDEPSAWIAKVAITGETTTKGTRRVETDVKTIRSWAASEGAEEVAEESGVIEVDKTEQFLYTINCKLDVQTGSLIDEDFAKRVEEINKPKYVGFRHGAGRSLNSLGAHVPNASVGRGTSNPVAQGIMELFPEDDKGYDEAATGGVWTDWDEHEAQKVDSSPRDKGCFSPGKVKAFLACLLSQDIETKDEVGAAVIAAENLKDDEYEALTNAIDDQFDKMVNLHFNIKADYIDTHCIAWSAMDVMAPFQNSKIFEDLTLVLEERILPQQIVSKAITERLTGLEYDEVNKTVNI